MQKLFYFCLKKTGNLIEAEDLTQDIALNVLNTLENGATPACFSAWVWRIARNRYASWAKRKHRQNETIAACDIGDLDIDDKSEAITDQMIHSEQMACLRRELAFIRSDYRHVLVAYYLENKSVHDIAVSQKLSEAAVKLRLHRARNLLKEGMDMAREFGRLSYNPENVVFVMNGMVGKGGEPWNYISRSLCKNILLAAYRAPSTVEELAMEIGVALPYMEEELSLLTEATLMKKNGDRYEANLFIVSRGAQEKIYAHLERITPALTDAIIQAMEFDIAWRNSNYPEWHEGYQSFEDMKWALLMMETDAIQSYTLKPFGKDASEIPNIGPWGHTLRPNGGEWDLLGMECYHGKKPHFVGLSGCVSHPDEKELPEIWFRQYKFSYGEIENKTPPSLTYADGQGMVAVANRKSDTVDESVLKRLESYGYIRKTGGGYLPTVMVMHRNKTKPMLKEARERFEALRYQAQKIATQHYWFCREQIEKEIPVFLKEDVFQIAHACANIFAIRGAVLEEGIRRGYLILRSDDAFVPGAYLLVP